MWWDRAYLKKLRQLEMDVWLYLRYVDDTNMILESFKPGTRFINNKITILQETIAQDKEIPPDKRAAKVLKDVANSVISMIVMEEDFPTNHPSGRLPILDLEVWVVDNLIRHQFYKNSMASRKVVQASSAFSTGMKHSILVEEGLRRLRNCSPELLWAKKIKFLNMFSSDLRYSGHTESFRTTVLKKVVGRYKVELSNHLEGKVKMFRTREEREQCEERKRKNQIRWSHKYSDCSCDPKWSPC